MRLIPDHFCCHCWCFAVVGGLGGAVRIYYVSLFLHIPLTTPTVAVMFGLGLGWVRWYLFGVRDVNKNLKYNIVKDNDSVVHATPALVVHC